jgi:hypothetical protein
MGLLDFWTIFSIVHSRIHRDASRSERREPILPKESAANGNIFETTSSEGRESLMVVRIAADWQ